MGETLYRRPGDYISMRETLFRYRVSGKRLHFGEALFRGEILFRDTGKLSFLYQLLGSATARLIARARKIVL